MAKPKPEPTAVERQAAEQAAIERAVRAPKPVEPEAPRGEPTIAGIAHLAGVPGPEDMP